MEPSKSSKQQQISATEQQFFSGPLPPPDALAKYEQIQSGFAERLLAMAEKEQNERIDTQNKIIDTQKKIIDTEKELTLKELSNFKRGQILALISVLAVVFLCGYAFYLGSAKEARDIGVIVIAALAGVFIAGRFYIKKKNLSN